MYLVLTSDHLFVPCHRHQVGCEEFHTRKQSNEFPMRTKQRAFNRKGHNLINNLASYGELFTG